MLQALDKLQTEKMVRNWPDELIRAQPSAVVADLARWNGKVVAISEATKNAIKSHGKDPTSADKAFCLKVAAEKTVTRTTHQDPEAYIQSVGGAILYTPTHMMIQKLDGTKVTVVNAPIPLPIVGDSTQRPNVQHVAAICSAVVRQTKGQWESIGGNFAGVLSEDGVDVAELTLLGTIVVDFIATDEIWNAKSSIDRCAVTGITQLSFIMDFLNRMDQIIFDYISTYIVVRVLRAFVCKNGQWYERMNEKDQPAVSHSLYEKVQRKGSQYAKQFKKLPGVYAYKGGYVPKVISAEQDGTLQNASKAIAQLRGVTGGDKSSIMLLAGMKDMSGYASEFGKRLQFTLAATLFSWSRGRQVDIRLSTIGDLAILVSSLQHQAKAFQARKSEFPFPTDPFMFLPSKRTPTAYPDSIRPYILIAHREKAVVIWYNDHGLPTSADKGVKVDFNFTSQDLVPQEVDKRDFIAYSPLYGALPFMRDPKVQAELNGRTDGLKYPGNYCSYSFGTASKFCGVLSTFTDVHLVGYGLSSNKKDLHYIFYPLIRFENQSKWYDKVIIDVKSSYCFLFGVRHRYSGISSLAYMSKKSVHMLLSDAVPEGDLYVSATIARKRDEVRASAKPIEMVQWGEEEEEEDEMPRKIPVRAPPVPFPRPPAMIIQPELEVEFDVNSISLFDVEEDERFTSLNGTTTTTNGKVTTSNTTDIDPADA